MPDAEPTPTGTILVVDDEESICSGCDLVLTEHGYRVHTFLRGKPGLASLKKNSYDLVLLDLKLPDMDGMEVIKKVKAEKPDTEVVVITGYGTAANAVEAMKLGAHDFLPKPFTEEQIKAAIGDALKGRVEEGPEPVAPDVRVAEGRLIQKREVIQALNRTTEDKAFWRDLMENGPLALEGYQLSSEAKAAIASGDLKWINENVGELTQKQLMFIYKRLEMEAW